jgi:hypothetical protein
VNLPAKAKPLTLYSGRCQYKWIYNINYTSNSHVNLIHWNIIYAFLLIYPWEWRFIAETCSKVELYVQYIIVLHCVRMFTYINDCKRNAWNEWYYITKTVFAFILTFYLQHQLQIFLLVFICSLSTFQPFWYKPWINLNLLKPFIQGFGL